MLKFCKKPNGSEIQGLDWPIQISFQQPLSVILTQKFSFNVNVEANIPVISQKHCVNILTKYFH